MAQGRHRKPPKGLIAGALALGVLCTPQAASSQDSWLRNGEHAPPDPSRASSGEFAVQMISTLDPDGLFTAWNTKGEGVRIVAAQGMRRHQPIATFAVFTGCQRDGLGQCNVTGVFDVLDPAGQPYAHHAVDIWVGLPPPPGRNLQLSMNGLGLRIEDKDPLGTYRVKLTVTDMNAGITLATEQSLTATAE